MGKQRDAHRSMSHPYLPVTPATSSSTTVFPSSPNSLHVPTSSATAGPSTPPGVTRSRTLFYLSIRDSSVTPRRGPKRSAAGQYGSRNDLGDEEDGLLGARDRKGLPPRWCVVIERLMLYFADSNRVDMSDEIEETLGRCHGKSEPSFYDCTSKNS